MALTLTTWNLQGNRGVDVDAVAAYLAETGSDVVALQEVQKRHASSIARAVSAKSLTWSFKHWPMREPSEGLALVGITRKVTGVHSRALTLKWRFWSWRRRIYQRGTVSPPDGESTVTLVNLHLSPHSAGHEDREREVRHLARVLGRSEGPLAAVGDYNARPDDSVFDPMVEAGHASVGGGVTNWHGEPSDRVPEQQLDYIWLSGGVTADKVILPVHGDEGFSAFPAISDHLPLTARLTAP